MAKDEKTTTSNRGFAAMDQKKQKEIARKGGQAAHQKGTAHEFTSEEARAAGKKGGEAVSVNRQHMSEIGRKGGQSRSRRRKMERSGSSDRGTSDRENQDGHNHGMPA